jgi:hypothetical protein
MGYQRMQAIWLGLALGVLGESAAVASAQSPAQNDPAAKAANEFQTRQSIAAVPLDRLPPNVRDGVRRVLEQPTLAAHGPAEVFRAQASFYRWLLDHPDRAVQMWHRLGARCIAISERSAGKFGWADGQGTDIAWHTIHRAPGLQVWYAEGVATPGPVLPPVPLRAVVILRYAETSALSPLLEGQTRGRTLMFHQADIFVQTDSQTAALIAKLLGSSAPKLAEKCIAQMEMFFSALAWYVDRHPERAVPLLSGLLPPGPAN